MSSLLNFIKIKILTSSLFNFIFLALFADLGINSHLGVISYGVSMTTLEDVFLKLEVEAEIDQAGEKQICIATIISYMIQ